MSGPVSAGYAIATSTALWGGGPTEAAAWADAAREGFPDKAAAVECTAGVLAELGGDWTTRDGIICTPAEAEAADEAAESAAEADEAIIDMIADGELDTIDGEWGAERREMARAMLSAFRSGHPGVRQAKSGRIVWAHAGDPRLSDRRREAARQMADRLGDKSWLRKIDYERLTRLRDRQTYLADVGAALHGAEWVSPLARDLDVSLRTMQRWAAGEVEVPAGVVATDLPALLRLKGPARARALRAEADRIERMMAG